LLSGVTYSWSAKTSDNADSVTILSRLAGKCRIIEGYQKLPNAGFSGLLFNCY